MYLVIQISLRSPFLTGLLIVSLLLVLSILLSDWAEKRRNRKLQKLIDRSRQLQRQGTSSRPASRQTAGAVPGQGGARINDDQPGFFRSRFVWLGLVLVAAGVILLQTLNSRPVAHARTVQGAPEPAPGSGNAGGPAGERMERVAKTWYTNQTTRSRSRLAILNPDANPVAREGSSDASPQRIRISAPARPVADRGVPASVGWDMVRSVHPEKPSPPPKLPPVDLSRQVVPR
jgi:hypothetical protein